MMDPASTIAVSTQFLHALAVLDPSSGEYIAPTTFAERLAEARAARVADSSPLVSRKRMSFVQQLAAVKAGDRRCDQSCDVGSCRGCSDSRGGLHCGSCRAHR